MSQNDPSAGYNPYAPPSRDADRPMGQYDDEEQVQILAERGTRWGARMIDTLLWVGAGIPGAIVYFTTKEDGSLALFILCLAVLVYQWYLISNTGQTLGKKWLGIKIVKMDGSEVNFVSGVILREWVLVAVSFIPFIGRFISLIDSVMIFGQQRRCLHDNIAGTKVILALPKI
jgi:uncharacterized RDD family membrane protein YckC